MAAGWRPVIPAFFVKREVHDYPGGLEGETMHENNEESRGRKKEKTLKFELKSGADERT